jgi:phosphoribosylformylglycinamidine synthase subunit PurL
VRTLIAEERVTAVHDCGDGGAAVALAEMALAGGIGATIPVVPQIANPGAILFGEDQGRYILTTADPATVSSRIEQAGLHAIPLGTTGGDVLVFDLIDRSGPSRLPLEALRRAHESFFPGLMGKELAVA